MPFLVVMTAIFVLVLALLFHLTWSGRKISYELGDTEFRINFSPMKFRISYCFIKDIQIVRITLLLRLFGGSWPGLHWGLFKANVGRVIAYATKRKGEFVLIRLVDGRKIAISPDKPEEFLNEIDSKRELFGTSSTSDFRLFETSKKFVYAQVLTVVAAYLLFLGYFLSVYPSLPDVIPMHFDINWNPNRWAHKSELFAIAGIATIFPIINAILTLKFGKYGKTLVIFLGSIFTLVIALFLTIINTIHILS